MVLESVECPVCGGTNGIKHGKSGEGKQRYLCQDQECWVVTLLFVKGVNHEIQAVPLLSRYGQ